MSLRVLGLDPLHLLNPDAHLKLSVVSAAGVRIPQSISSLADNALVKALTSGDLWVSRGIACHLDIQIFFNGKPLDGSRRTNVLESLGDRIRDTQLWSQLSLSASLDVWQNDDPSDLKPDLSIRINHGMDTATPQTRHRAWVLETFDIKPPDSILCAELERLQIRFDFVEIRKKAKRVKRAKSVEAEFHSQEEMLLDSAPDFDTYGTLDELVHAVDGMKGLSGLIDRCFASPMEFVEDPDLLQQPPLSFLKKDPGLHSFMPEQIVIEMDLGNANSGESRKGWHPKATTEILNSWMEAHAKNPYPSKTEKLELVRITGLEMPQVNRWFTRNRRSLRTNATLTEDEMLLKQIDEEATPLIQSDDHEDDDMLLSQAIDKTPSLISQPSAASSILSTARGDLLLKRAAPDNEATLLDKPPACQLGEAAIHILISGYVGHGLRMPGGIQVDKPPPSLTMACLAPATFCSGFKESMAHNAHFVPTISRAVSVSWPRNIQSPTLRQKLIQLANCFPSSLTNETCDGDGEAGTTTRVTAVVQSRIWGMMQRKLYNPSDTAKIWRKPKLQGNLAEEDECPDLFGTLGEPDKEQDRAVTELGEFSDDEMGEFDDLLADDDEGLLEDLEEREKLSVERETDEMLFGSGSDENEVDEDSVYLLDGEDGSGIMLLYKL